MSIARVLLALGLWVVVLVATVTGHPDLGFLVGVLALMSTVELL